jgi:hypothetical protein
VHRDLAGIDRREEVLPEERHQHERQQHHREEGDDERLAGRKRTLQQRAVAGTDTLEAMLEAALEAH